MKFLVVISALLAVACAKPTAVVAPVAPLAYSVAPASHFGYSSVAHHVKPVTYAYAHPYSYAAPVAAPVAPVAHAYAAPFAHNYAAPFAHTYAAPIAHAYAAPVAHAYAAPVVAPVAALEKTQYHAQDIFGQATYGHAEAFQSHSAVQDIVGNKVGAYSYVAPNGEVISTKYVAGINGVQVETNALPVAPADTPEVAAAKVEHLKAVEEAKSRSRRAVVAPFGYAHPYAYSHPYAYNTVPVSYTHYTPVHHGVTSYSSDVVTPFHQTHSYNYKHF